MKTVFEEDHLVCHFNEENNVLHHIWKDKAKGDQFRNGLLKVYDAYIALKKEHPGLHWLADTRNLSVLPLADQQWLDDTWNELLFVQAGVKTHAVIIGDDAFAKYAMEKFKNTMTKRYASQQIKLETFVDEREAYDWFKKLNQSR